MLTHVVRLLRNRPNLFDWPTATFKTNISTHVEFILPSQVDTMYYLGLPITVCFFPPESIANKQTDDNLFALGVYSSNDPGTITVPNTGNVQTFGMFEVVFGLSFANPTARKAYKDAFSETKFTVFLPSPGSISLTDATSGLAIDGLCYSTGAKPYMVPFELFWIKDGGAEDENLLITLAAK